MSAVARHREAIVQTASRLFRQQGYAATGLNQIVAESGAPKGSIYHYFPQGKQAIAVEAVGWAGERVAATLHSLAAEEADAGHILRRYAQLLAGWMAESGFTDGCPIATTVLETVPGVEPVRRAAAAALSSWSRVFAVALQAHGVAQAKADRLATTAVAVIEGALIQARVAVDAQPLQDAAEEMACLFDAAVAASVGRSEEGTQDR